MGNGRKGEGGEEEEGWKEGVSVSVYMMCDLCIFIHGSGIGLDWIGLNWVGLIPLSLYIYSSLGKEAEHLTVA